MITILIDKRLTFKNSHCILFTQANDKRLSN